LGEDTVLPGTKPWNYAQTIVAEQYQELRAYYERLIADAARKRESLRPDREEFRRMIGAVDPMRAPKPKTEVIGRTPDYWVSLVDWPILPLGTIGPTMTGGRQVREYGIVLEPRGSGPFQAMIAVADATSSAADIAGLTSRLPAGKQFARELALAGYVVFVPFFTERRPFSEPWLDDRSWLFRLAYLTGHHLIGSEVQQVFSAVDYLSAMPAVDRRHIGVAGEGQGGLLALYAAALDTRLELAIVAKYLDRREPPYDEPEDRMLWGLLTRFGDREIASMIAPRKLVTSFPKQRTHSSERTVTLSPTRVAEIQNGQFAQWQAWYRNRAQESYREREARWRADTSSIENYRLSIRPQLEAYFDAIGRYPQPSGPFDALSVKVYDLPEFTGYRLRVRVYDGVNAYGILLVPKGIRAGERLPVVFTQHGSGGRPEDAIGVEDTPYSERLYARFGMRLAQRRYIVYAPMISVQAPDSERTGLVRRSHLLGLTPVGLELKKFSRVLDFLETLPFVDKDRCAFYGFSHGGYTAIRIGPGEPRFKVVIDSGNFNDTTSKYTDLTMGTSFLFDRDGLEQYHF